MPRSMAFAAGAVVALLSTPVLAGPVNTEKLLSNSDDGGWSGSASTDLSLSRGNVDQINLSFSGSLEYKTLHPEGAGFGDRGVPKGAPRFYRDQWFVTTEGAFAEASGENIKNKGFYHLRWNRMWIPRLGSFAFVQMQYNQFTLLEFRGLVGVGARFDAIHRKVVRLWGGSGYMAEYEVNDTVDDDPHPARVLNHRWTNHVVFSLRLYDNRLVIRNTLYLQPRWDDFLDVRILESFEVEARVGDAFSLGIDIEVDYDSRPPQTVESTDLTVAPYLKLSFG